MNQKFLKQKTLLLLSGILLIFITGTGCGGSGEIEKSGSVTSTVQITGISATASSITFTWTDPTVSGFDHVVITCSDGTYSGNSNVTKGTGTFTQSTLNSSSLSSSTLYIFTAKSMNAGGTLLGSNIFYVKTTSSGTSTFTIISTVDQLKSVADDLGGNYLLTADLDLKDTSWTAIGTGGYYSLNPNPFTGIFNGNGHVISNLTINSSVDCLGLFGAAKNAAVSNLGLESVTVSGGEYSGALIGYNESAAIADCYASGSVNGSGYTGGLIGWNSASAVTNCYSSCAVSGGDGYTGGLTGINNNSSKIKYCYAVGIITGSGITGGLAGYNTATITACYYDTTTSGMSDTDRGTPLTTAQMKIQTNYSGWDFTGDSNGSDDIWSIDTKGTINGGYPYLTNLEP